MIGYLWGVVAGRRRGLLSCCGGRASAAWCALPLAFFLGAVSTGFAQWAAQDIGAVATAGSSSNSSGTVTVAGSGADIWGASDEFQFYYQAISGDVTLTARITGLTNTNGWAKAGVMIRQSLDPNAANVFLAATPDWHGIVAQQRSATGGQTTSVNGPAVRPPRWLRLTRAGNAITAATSVDGASWTTTGTFTAAMNVTVLVGLAVTSHQDGTLCTATFDNLTANAPGGPGSPPTAPTNLVGSTAASTQIALSWTNTSTSATEVQVERSTDGTNFVHIVTLAGNTSNYTDSAVGSSSTYYYRVRSANAAGFSPYSNVATVTGSSPPPASGTWQSRDIGTSTAGQTTASGDTVTLTGSGRDIWNTSDGFRYYYQPLSGGDREIIVRVASLQNTNGWAKAGIMLRQSLEPGSAQAWVNVSAEHGTSFQWRETTGGETQSSAPSEDGPPPRWLKLVFKDAGTDEPIPPRVWSFVSRDGANWTAAGSMFLHDAWGYIGLAVTSHNDGTLCTAQFDNLLFITPPPAPTGLQVLQRGPNGAIDVGWSYGAGADSFEIQANAQRPSSHDWVTVATAPGTARQATINIGDNDTEQVKITAYRDFVASAAASFGYLRATVTPALSVIGETSSSVSLRIHERQFGLHSPQSGPWSLERSSDGVNFAEIAGGLRPNNGPWDTDYTDTTIPPGATRYYRARQLLTNGDRSAYSAILSATARTASSPPAAPSNLSATATSPTSVSLTWTDNSSDEENFEVGRSTDGVTYFALASPPLPPNSTSFTDTTASPGTFYYYRVGAFKAGVGATSNVATVTTPGTPTASGWISRDVGSTGAAGSMSASGDTITVRGAGADVWGGADSFQFTHLPIDGAGTLTARVVSITNTNGWAKAGLMIRESLAAGARNVFIAATPDWHGIVGQHRDATGGPTAQVPGPAVRPPYWLRLSRASDFTSVSTSVDGVTWTEFASWSSALISPNALIGFAVTSHASGTLCTATFDRVSLVTSSAPPPPPPAPPAAPASLTATPQSNSQIELAWSDQSTDEAGFQIERASASAGPYTLFTTTAANTTRHIDGGLAAGTTYYYRVRATNGAGNSAYSNVASATTAAASSWASADIGNVGRAGSDTASGSTITINGAGADVWGTADAFRFVSRTWTGDGVVEARVVSMGNTNGWAKAGVMIRENTTAGARNVFVALTPSWHGIVAQTRSDPNGVTTQAAGPGRNAPYWVRIARSGSQFTVATSADGVTWTSFATFNLTMGATAHFGFAVTSHDTTQLNQAVFEDPYVGAP